MPTSFSQTVIAALVAFLSALAPDLAFAKRVALVIANSEYANTKKLINPAHDGELIAGNLKTLGFEVRLETNVDARRFSEVLQDFALQLDKESDALFYYAGHGLQFRGENFLVGVDAHLKSEAALQFETYGLNAVVNLLEGRASTLLFFWDACRNNPLAEALVSGPTGQGRSAPGLTRSGAAPLPPRRGDTLIVFSAEPGKEALDGSGKNSPFAEALGRRIASPNVEIESMLKYVTADVLAATQHFQRPERLSQLTRDFFFVREGREEAAYEAELRSLRAKLAQLESEPAGPRRRFRIINADDPSFRDTVRVTTRSTVSRGQDAKSELPAEKPKETGSVRPLGDAANTNVVIAVNQSSAALVRKLRVAPNAKLLALGDDDGIVRVVRLETFEVVFSTPAHTARISDLDFSPDSRVLLSSGRDGFVRYWNVETGEKIRELSQPGTIPYSARMNSAFPDRWILMGDRGGRLVAWDLKGNRIITNTVLHNGPVHSVGYQPNGGGAYLSAGGDGELKIRQPMGQRVSVRAHTGPLFQASYSANGNLLYTVGSDRKVKIWDSAMTTDQQPKAVLDGHLRYVIAADMSVDEKILASGGGDKVVNLWNVTSGQLMARLEGHTSDIEAITFSPNGKFLVSTSEDKSVRIWSIENREELVRMFFRKGEAKFAGVTLENQTFGDKDAGLISIYVDGRQVVGADADRAVQYIGRRIAIIDGEK
jgi:WD40 repeat protein/uncharacterized caspase-like protein